MPKLRTRRLSQGPGREGQLRPPGRADGTLSRPLTIDDSVFVGNLIDHDTGRISGAQSQWEDAAHALLSRVYGPDFERMAEMAADTEVPDGAYNDEEGLPHAADGTPL
jgi:hypothetical protein